MQCPHLKTTSFILEYCPHVDFRDLYLNLSLPDIKIYMRQLFKVLTIWCRASTTCTPTESCTEILSLKISCFWTLMRRTSKLSTSELALPSTKIPKLPLKLAAYFHLYLDLLHRTRSPAQEIQPEMRHLVNRYHSIYPPNRRSSLCW